MPAKRKNPGGRPDDLTPAVAKKVCAALALGNTRHDSARAAGIGPRTLCRWMAKGKKAKAGKYWQLWRDIEAAESKAAFGFVGLIRKAAHERDVVTVKETSGTDLNGNPTVRRETVTKREFDWAAAAWWLERARPEDWSANKHELRELRKQLDLMARQLAEITRGNGPPLLTAGEAAQLPGAAGAAGAAGGGVDPRPAPGGPDAPHAGGGAGPRPVAGGTDPQPGPADHGPLHPPVGQDPDGGGEGGGPLLD